jgi:hypothetical protein
MKPAYWQEYEDQIAAARLSLDTAEENRRQAEAKLARLEHDYFCIRQGIQPDPRVRLLLAQAATATDYYTDDELEAFAAAQAAQQEHQTQP